MKTFSIRPIQDDVRNQLDATHKLLDAIDEIAKLKAVLTDESQIKDLERIEEALAGVTSDLMDNAGKVSKFVQEVAF
ncbi:hypothetical protein [Terasakiella pusilla]|uniref:hypothetical protein n=1 Tax=Terasakiella pusilla TaxID=64973 RepID=UPI003AA805E8